MRELPSEAAARQQQQQLNSTSTSSQKADSGPSEGSESLRPKSFNILMYKFHALRDYTRTIKLFGTTDSYTTQVVRLFQYDGYSDLMRFLS